MKCLCLRLEQTFKNAGQLVWEQGHLVNKCHSFLDLELRNGEIFAYEGTGEARFNPQTGELTDWLMTK